MFNKTNSTNNTCSCNVRLFIEHSIQNNTFSFRWHAMCASLPTIQGRTLRVYLETSANFIYSSWQYPSSCILSNSPRKCCFALPPITKCFPRAPRTSTVRFCVDSEKSTFLENSTCWFVLKYFVNILLDLSKFQKKYIISYPTHNLWNNSCQN